MKKYIPLFLSAIFPYYIALSLFCSKFHDNRILILTFIFIFWIAAVICNISIFAAAVTKQWDTRKLLHINMLVKLIPIPAYIFIFLSGAVYLIKFAPMVIALIFLDCMAITLSGIIGLTAITRSHADKLLSTPSAIMHGIFQFVFCFDIISSIILFRKGKTLSK